MRLIDADILKYHDVYEQEWLGDGGRYTQAIYRDEIDKQPTVDAVPVLYIKETIAWAKENGSVEYADYLSHLLSAWAERKE